MSKRAKYNLYSAPALVRRMNDILVEKLASQYKVYQSRWLTITIGLSKILNATILMLLYAWRVGWDQKFTICVTFVVLSCLTYAVEYGLSWFWWPNYRATLSKSDSTNRLVLCSHSPFFSGTYHLTFHLLKSGSFFQRLPPPLVEETIPFAELFTEGGYMLEHLWQERCVKLINRALSKMRAD
jgi:hypothetical protein